MKQHRNVKKKIKVKIIIANLDYKNVKKSENAKNDKRKKINL